MFLVDYDWKTYLKGFHFPEEEEKKLAKEIFQSDIWNERDKGFMMRKNIFAGL